MPIDGNSYTFDHQFGEEGAVAFACDTDAAKWRWLALPPTHPIFIQTMNYHISVECSAARGTLDPTKWSALTWMDWEVGEPGAGIPLRGTMKNRLVGENLGFGIELLDAQDRLVYRAGGKGVVFQTRDFEGWRNKAKDKLDACKPPPQFAFASRDDVGALEGEHSLIALLDDDAKRTTGLIAQANGMPPGSRYLDGSGDHVNAVHLAEAARQFCALLTRQPDIQLTGGEISFARYVEMNVPFVIVQIECAGSEVHMLVEQAGKPCTELRYRLG